MLVPDCIKECRNDDGLALITRKLFDLFYPPASLI